MNLSEIISCKEYSSNLPDDRKIVKLIVVNLIVMESCDGELVTLRSTMELQIPHGFLKRSILKVCETISKSQHRRFQSKSRRY